VSQKITTTPKQDPKFFPWNGQERIMKFYIIYLCLGYVYALKFRVCGSFCGPNWSNHTWVSESKCNQMLEPESHWLSGPSCADVCCRDHDKCCGHNKDISNCNQNIVKCLRSCNPLSPTCTLYGIPIPAGTIEFAMGIVEDWCCSEPCAGNAKM